ncbi:DUF1345 domain-containing protein [Actinoplanes sp. N902-109]|uniref:DUF1345 domain-containing protein n=1 Tax=Actinoplanes sp. (strain N902-109) TaxID=649831 RepID=UPI0005A1AE44|nr:DUF1345 domain-containing protein [Actinoplanes sp. N902-109]
MHRRLFSVPRAALSLDAGVLAGALTALLGAPGLALLAAWIVASGSVLTWVWRISWPCDADATKALAEAEPKARDTDAAILFSAVVGLAVVVAALVHAPARFGRTSVILGLVAVALCWALVNTVFAFKYARLYYLDTDGGIDFNQSAPPAYSDFAYLAFTVGMSFAISDTNLASTRIRKVALAHALLSYTFGTGVLAVAINLVTSL